MNLYWLFCIYKNKIRREIYNVAKRDTCFRSCTRDFGISFLLFPSYFLFRISYFLCPSGGDWAMSCINYTKNSTKKKVIGLGFNFSYQNLQ